MRRTRLLILLSILVILGSVGITYTIQRGLQQREAPPAPARLPEGITAQAANWTWSHAVGDFTKVEVLAKDFQQIAEPSKFQLRGVELRLFNEKKKGAFDRVTSAQADFDTASGVLFSDGEVEITMGVPADPAQPLPTRVMRIKSSGVNFDSKAGKVATDRLATFSFENSSGEAKGAEYDSVNRELRLASDVKLLWRGERLEKNMEVTAGNLLYKEVESKIFLAPWAKLVRGTFTLEGGDSVVTVTDGAIEQVESQKARGADTQPKRTLEYAADKLRVGFSAKGEVETITGESNARLSSRAATAETTVDTHRLEMQFDTAAESTLKRAEASGPTVVESKPGPAAGAAPPDTRILRATAVELNMRSGGQEIERALTHSPGTLEFLPNRPGGRKRTLNGERIWIEYGPENRIRSFRAVTVATRTEPAPPAKGKPPGAPALTWSKDMTAAFEPKTGALERLEQWNNFRYEEGERRARSEKAVLESATDEITLTGAARVWDPTGSTEGDRIVLNQQTGAVEATGKVSSTRMPEQRPAAKPGEKPAVPAPTPLLTGSDPIQAKAARMTTTEGNQLIRYVGSAVLWQGANRITADDILIDRNKQMLTARGNVVSQFVDQAKASDGDKKKSAKPVFTVVRAPELVYSDKDRLAHYRGGASMRRPGVAVDARELRAWLSPAEAGKESALDRVFADGQVKIVQSAPDRTRTGTGEHGEYYLADERMLLNGGTPQLVDTVKGTTRGRQLTWFARNDRLLVDGAEAQPAITVVRKK